MRSKGSWISAASKRSLLSTMRMWQDTPPSSNWWRITSASRGLSSKWSTRSGLGISEAFSDGRLRADAQVVFHAPRHFVNHSPKRADLPHRFDEVLELHRLDH